MGNIGHLNCEPGTHTSKDKPELNQSNPSRIELDLSSSPHQADYMDATSSPMIRRAVGKVPHICIVGAGVAGLRCADILLQHGAKVTILEARTRVGGRLCQGDALGHLVDLGPNWIHGTDDNPILDLAKQTGTLTMNWDGRQAVFDSKGEAMEEKETAKNEEIVWEVIGMAMKYSNAESANISAQKSLYNFFEEKLEEMFPRNKSKQETILQMAEMWGAFVGSPIQTQSLKFFWLEECIDGENLFVAGTYKKVLGKIAEPAIRADLRFEHKVTKILSREEEGDPRVTIELEDRKKETFDEVVMTAPLGWLKRNLGAFEPELPQRLKEAIGAIGYGHLDKVSYIVLFTSNDSLKIYRSTSPSQQLSGMNPCPPPFHQLHLTTQAYQTSPQRPLQSIKPQQTHP
jgi:monoamine oxidase